MVACSPATSIAPLIADIGTEFLLPAPLCADHKFRDKLNEMWRLSVDDANECEDCTDLTDCYRQAYLANCIRLTHFAASLAADLKHAEQREDWFIDVWRDALCAAVDVTAESYEEVHRGPYVPRGEYREWMVECSVEGDVTIDLADFDDDCPIPRTVEADYGGVMASGQHFDCVLTFTLTNVCRRGKGDVAIFSCEITG